MPESHRVLFGLPCYVFVNIYHLVLSKCFANMIMSYGSLFLVDLCVLMISVDLILPGPVNACYITDIMTINLQSIFHYRC
uniref:Uncharacterized protein n=1 Tax=Rhizophora mucronata TaxID=61149 RepID=A0A2P2KBV8_RHIMU